MTFTCLNEVEISGGSEKERRAAADLVLAFDSVDEDSASREERPAGGSVGEAASLAVRFESVDGLPEEELAAIAPQFPGLSFTLAYFSLDGEFYGYSRPAPEGAAAGESEDFAADTRDIVARRHDGDRIAFVRDRFGLDRA